MDSATAEKTARNLSLLLNSPGWKDWFVPFLKNEQEKIKTSLTSPSLSAEDTAKFRHRYALLGELLQAPELHLGQMQGILAEKAGE